jgi:hypothetical protein
MTSISLTIAAYACPVKQEIYRVAERHAGKGVAIKVFVVSKSPIEVPRNAMISRSSVPELTLSTPLGYNKTWVHARSR